MSYDPQIQRSVNYQNVLANKSGKPWGHKFEAKHSTPSFWDTWSVGWRARLSSGPVVRHVEGRWPSSIPCKGAIFGRRVVACSWSSSIGSYGRYVITSFLSGTWCISVSTACDVFQQRFWDTLRCADRNLGGKGPQLPIMNGFSTLSSKSREPAPKGTSYDMRW